MIIQKVESIDIDSLQCALITLKKVVEKDEPDCPYSIVFSDPSGSWVDVAIFKGTITITKGDNS